MAKVVEKKRAILVHLTEDQLMRIEWLQETTPASRSYFIRKALDEFLRDVQPPGLTDQP